MELLHAFTTSYNQLSNKLINEAILKILSEIPLALADGMNGEM